MANLLSIFPEPRDILALTPEDLGGLLVEFIQARYKGTSGFMLSDFVYQLYPSGGSGYPDGPKLDVTLALAEAMSWLESQGVIVLDPRNQVPRYLLTRRGRALKSKADVEVFRKSKALPIELLQPALSAKVHALFVRGDYDTAVFQAFKEVEVAVRKATGLPPDLLGKNLMAKAFDPDSGILRDDKVVSAERQAEQQLFMGAMGHAKNPVSHREVNLTMESAARLVVFASHLLYIVEQRALV